MARAEELLSSRPLVHRVAVALFVCLAASPAAADSPPKRAVPDYDGREGEPPSVGEVLIWVPRVLLFPAYLVTEYVIRRPIGALVTLLDREKIIERFMSSDNPIGAFPTVLVDFGLRPSFGIYAFAEPFLHHDNRLRVSGAYGGKDWLTLAAKDRFRLDAGDSEVVVQGSYSRRADYPFYGIGPDARQEDETFYTLEHSEVSVYVALRRRHVAMTTGAQLFRDTRAESTFGRPTESVFDTEAIAGWNGATLCEQHLTLSLDSRPHGAAFALRSGTGARMDVRGGLAFGLDNPAQQRFVRYGAEISLFLDLTGTRRVVGINVQIEEVDALGGLETPMSYLRQLGGRESMRGFFLGRFVGESTVDATLAYRWPIASFLDAELFVGAGNAFGRRFAGFSPSSLVGDGGLAIRTNTSRDISFDLIAAVGSRRFDQGPLQIDSFRLSVGANRGF